MIGRTIALMLLLAAPAQAGTVAFEPGDATTGPAYRYVAAPGEVNAVTVAREPDGILLTDTGTSIAGCPAAGPNAVRCPGFNAQMLVDAGDGDDTVSGDEAARELRGGPGNDQLRTTAPAWARSRLVGDEGDDVLTGGPGPDELLPGPGADRVSGGADADFVSAGDDDLRDDVLDGGPDRDAIHYSGRVEPVTVDLAAGVGGQGFERDRLAGFEDVYGGNGRDVLRGDDRVNELNGQSTTDTASPGDVLDGRGATDYINGSPGPDELIGGADKDIVRGYGGADRVRAGPGDDQIWLREPNTAVVLCGPGPDRVSLDGESGALVGPDCERVRTTPALVRIRRDTRRLRLTINGRRGCEISLNGRRVGDGTVSLPLDTDRVALRCSWGYPPASFRLTS